MGRFVGVGELREKKQFANIYIYVYIFLKYNLKTMNQKSDLT